MSKRVKGTSTTITAYVWVTREEKVILKMDEEFVLPENWNQMSLQEKFDWVEEDAVDTYIDNVEDSIDVRLRDIYVDIDIELED